MGLFYRRIETGNEITIIYKYNVHFWVAFVVLILLGGFVNLLFYFVAAVAVIVYMIDLMKPSGEIKKAMKKGAVQMSGSKYSFSNPTKIVIKKN